MMVEIGTSENADAIFEHLARLSINAFYDYDQPLLGANSGGYTDSNANWMNEPTPPTSLDSYFTEPISFTSPISVDIQKYPGDYNNPVGFNGSAYVRSQLDGISVDFTPNDYEQIITDPTIATIPQFNGTDLASTFDTNNLTIGRNSLKINGATADLVVDVEDSAIQLVS